MNEEGICQICNGKGTVSNPKGKRLIPWWLSPLGWLISKDDTVMCKDCDGKGTTNIPSERV